MDEGTAAIVGAVAGGVLTLLGNWLSHYLQTHRTVSLDKIRRERLTQLLNAPKYKWRSMDMLASAIGADEETTAALLLEIGARASMAGSDSWGLISRNPYPNDVPSK
jgi:hypothetical protein